MLDTFKLHPAKARTAIDNARREYATGDVELATKLTVMGLMDCPNWYPGYQFLGEMLDSQNQRESAIQAYQGGIPDALVDRYLSPDPAVTGNGGIYDRVIVHRSESFELPRPGGLDDNTAWKFGNQQVVANETWVDTIDSGRVWHDGHNTVVYDATGGVVDDHSFGNITVINALVRKHKPVHIAPRVFLLGARGGGNYYHWMTDILPKLAILQGAGYTFTASDRFVVPTNNKSFQEETLVACGLVPEQIIASTESSPYLTCDLLVVPRLTNVMGLKMGSWLPKFLQKSFLDQPQSDSSSSASDGNRIFISRDPAASNGRSIENLTALNTLFEDSGFEIVYPERLSLKEQAQKFHNASVLFAPHGAGLANIVFCKPGTRVVEFYGAHIAPCYWAISAIMGLHYYNEFCLTAQHADDPATLSARRTAGFAVNLDRAGELIKLVAD